MSKNKGKPSQQKADERKELGSNGGPGSPRSIHRLDRSRTDEKGGKGAGNRRSIATGSGRRAAPRAT
jgi:hypothetical protein